VHWKTKAAIQRAFSRLPFGSEAAYYQLQRWLGELSQLASPLQMFREAVAIFAELRECGVPVEGSRVFEVGTGHRLHMPLAFYLAGARSITTVDRYPILKRDLVMAAVAGLREHATDVPEVFRSVADPGDVSLRLRKLTDARTFQELAATLQLQYLAPADATAVNLPGGSFDIHFSNTVFEHIPRSVLVGILIEASRLVASAGLICHHIDLSDHYSHTDPSINKINFLQFSRQEWSALENYRFGYQNRLRADDYAAIYREAKQQVLKRVEIVDRVALESLAAGFPLAAEYRAAAPEQLCTVSVRMISRPLPGTSD
jgi:hypothetical protein